MTCDPMDLMIGALVDARYQDDCACLVQADATGTVVIDEKCEEHA